MEEAAQSVTRRKTRAIAVAPRRRHALIRFRFRVADLCRSSREEVLTPLLAPRSPPLKQLMKYAVPAVLALLILRHQPKPAALFLENPAPLWSFVAATAIYWLVAEAMKRGRKRYRMLRRVAFAAGVQSALSLLSMFLPYPFSLLPLLIPVPFALFFACTRIILTLLISVINKIRAMAVRTRGVDQFTNEPHILPV